MKKFEVVALEKFVVRTTYFVDAADAQKAENLCRAGCVPYNDNSIEEGDEEWLETVSVKETALKSASSASALDKKELP
jgi:hypothetical protein